LNLDRLRELIRGDGKLRALGERFGGVRIYTALDMEVIQAAYEKRQEAKGKQKAGAE
jgi:hypothetical protein